MTLIDSITKRCIIAVIFLTFVGNIAFAKGKIKLSGRIIDSDEKELIGGKESYIACSRETYKL